MKKGLVSIVTPCYNAGFFIHRLLDSILSQDYPLIEMIVVDDGSNDSTKCVVEKYINRFKQKGYELLYIYQKHAGQATAVNRGIKLIKGEFLAWPDSDDFYSKKTSISEFVSTFMNLDDSYGLVRTIGRFIDESSFKPLNWNIKFDMSENLYEACLFGNAFLIVPINYMVKTKALDDVLPQRDIYTGANPQNLQLFEPLLYTYKCKTVHESLCNILVRNNSDSHAKKNAKKILEDMRGYLQIHLETLKRMTKMGEQEKLLRERQVITISYKKQLALCIRNKDFDSFYSVYSEAKNLHVHLPLKYFLGGSYMHIINLMNKVKKYRLLK